MDLQTSQAIRAQIVRWQGMVKPGAKCSGCNDIGYYLARQMYINKAPRHGRIPLSQIASDTFLEPCNCLKQRAAEDSA